MITLIGIDPGIVHTGCVMLRIDESTLAWTVEHGIVDGTDTHATQEWVKSRSRDWANTHVFIEAYRDRGTVFSTHNAMRTFEQNLKRALPGAKIIDNTGVKKIVTRKLMELLNVWKFPTTHHQDLQAAARIAIYGALKEPELNSVLTKIVMRLLGKE